MGLEHIKAGQKLIPEDGYLHTCEGNILAIQGKMSASYKAFMNAVAFGCDDIESTLFHRAILGDRSGLASAEEYLTHLEKFVDQADLDS